MKTALTFAALVLLSGSTSWAQVVNYVAFYAPAPVVVVPAQPVVAVPYVPQTVVTYSAPLYTQIYAPTLAVAAPVAHTPYSVAPTENGWVNWNGPNYTYREYGPLGATRYKYTVRARPYGYVVRERGF